VKFGYVWFWILTVARIACSVRLIKGFVVQATRRRRKARRLLGGSRCDIEQTGLRFLLYTYSVTRSPFQICLLARWLRWTQVEVGRSTFFFLECLFLWVLGQLVYWEKCSRLVDTIYCTSVSSKWLFIDFNFDQPWILGVILILIPPWAVFTVVFLKVQGARLTRVVNHLYSNWTQ
jgi:hypothetical protein